ncbi:hypothetical protein [Bauldia sp.]|uniref:hypothetical protein n=1 Tax=Bauldia sp. TaxID=2575872 RepID=UPI003BAC0CCC
MLQGNFAQQAILAGISALVGLAAGMVLASQEAEIADNRFFLQKQAETADRIAVHFSGYLENWRRLRDHSTDLSSRKQQPTNEEILLLRRMVDGRDASRDGLISSINSAALYFDSEVIRLAYEFQEWDEEQSVKPESELPKFSEWKKRSKRLLKAIREDLVQ